MTEHEGVRPNWRRASLHKVVVSSRNETPMSATSCYMVSKSSGYIMIWIAR